MKKDLMLIETISAGKANLIIEQHDNTKDSYLSGIFMQGEVSNGNGRIYSAQELAHVTESSMNRIKQGFTIYGELNHPDNLQIDLNNVSHIITEMRMDENNVLGKAKLLNTPKGQIAKAILEGGGKLGVSSRGSGNVVEGRVNGFSLVTIDIVANPSAPNAYPNHVMESLNNSQKVITLAEAVCEDVKAQKFFKKELFKLFEKLTGQQLNDK